MNGLDLTLVPLVGCDRRGCDWQGVILENAGLAGTDLRGLRPAAIVLRGAFWCPETLADVDLSCANTGPTEREHVPPWLREPS
ncbi:MAG: hypothetical protein KKA73_27645 [Chloroflexi bacterium]|nr:hypothetical protein [Chloroflexota bacterium]